MRSTLTTGPKFRDHLCVMGVCTGTVLWGMAGVLDGRKATTNKMDFLHTIHHAPKVDWVKEARWAKDGKFYTSSGVSAGMDMALAVMPICLVKAWPKNLPLGANTNGTKTQTAILSRN